MSEMLMSAWRYRYFICSSIQSEFNSRFIQSRLGGLWLVIHPLVQAAIFALVLGKLMAAKLPGMDQTKFAYPIYLLSGMLAWSLFTEIVTRCLTLFIDKGNFLKKIVFPRICLPLIIAGSAFINNLLLFAAMIIVFSVLGHVPEICLIWVPLLILLTLAFSLSIGLILGIFNVFIRDVGQVVPILLQLVFWATPIVYSPEILPTSLRSLLVYNPIAILTQSFQNVILFNRAPNFFSLSCLVLITMVLFYSALGLFRRASAEMVDIL